MRRLTHEEYRNTIEALLSRAPSLAAKLEPEPIGKVGLDTFAAALRVSPNLASQYADIAADLGKSFVAPACDAASQERDCARTFITTYGKRAFRRPLREREVERYLLLYDGERARSAHRGAIAQIVETMLQSPHFLYRFELGEPINAGRRKLTSYEVATQLSYLLTGSMPDEALFAEADRGALASPAQIETQARRLLALPAARPRLRGWLSSYAGISRLAELTKDVDVYPTFTPELRTAMQRETERFIDAVLWEDDGNFTRLMTAPYSFVDRTLAGLYGLPASESAELVKTTLDANERAGLLTHASVLAAHSKAGESFPILRGKFIRVGLLCQSLPAPPNVVPPAPPPDPSATTRERFALHAANPGCASCHALIDPLGFGLENYDGIGRYRTTENGRPVDASGEVTGTVDIDGPYQGGVELANKLAASSEARQCLARHGWRWAFGRFEGEAEGEVIAAVERTLAASGMDLRELMIAFTTTSSFVERSFD